MAAVRWTQRARDDLRDIHDFIARDSPRVAEALVERLLTATERLAAFPESGRVVPEFPALGYREIIVSSYRVLDRLADHAQLPGICAALFHGLGRRCTVFWGDVCGSTWSLA